jgi:hypothetical protein
MALVISLMTIQSVSFTSLRTRFAALFQRQGMGREPILFANFDVSLEIGGIDTLVMFKFLRQSA